MTRNEAEERAADIWGKLHAFRGYTITVLAGFEPGEWFVVLSNPSRQHPEEVHMLDANGHTNCHEVCLRREAAAN